MQEIYIDSLKLHDLSDGSNAYWIMPPIEGLSFTDLRLGSNPRAGDDGISINSSYLGERRISMRGKISKDNATDLLSSRRTLINALAPQRTSSGITLKTLRFIDLAGNDYRIRGEVIPESVSLDHPDHSTFYIDFLCHDSYFEAYTASNLTISPFTKGGFVLPVDLPIQFSSGTGGSGTATNSGLAPAYPTITLDGPLTNPRIENTTTGKHIALTLSITDGVQVVIDMASRTIVQGGVTNRLSAKSSGTFWPLQNGNNTIKLLTSTSGESGQATLSWRSAYYGI